MLAGRVVFALVFIAFTNGKDLRRYRSLTGVECYNAKAVFQLYTHCEIGSKIKSADEMFVYPESKQAFEQLIRTFCADVLPSAKECFAQNTSACNSEYLQQLVDSTGIQCQPGGTEPNSVLMYVLDRLESITVPSEECSHRIPQYCYDDASAESGMYAETLSSYTAEQVAPRAQNYLASVVECAIGWYKSRADRCPDWRSTILFFLAPNALPSFLGGQFPFTEAEMAELLEISD